MLEAEAIHAGYGAVPVLNGVSLRIAAGERIVIIGRNGVGKTALLRALMGFLRCRRGCIRLEGRDITRLPACARSPGARLRAPGARDLSRAERAREPRDGRGAGRPVHPGEGAARDLPAAR